MTFPDHIELHLAHNENAGSYQRVEDYYSGHDATDWVSPEQRQKAIDIQSVWELHWYPRTPVGFCRLLAADLDVLLATALETTP